MKDPIKNGLLKIKSHYQNISPEYKVKIAGILATVPIIAANIIDGAFAGGCPLGLACSSPGQCGRYIDGDGDGLCDLAQTSATTTNTDSSSQDSETTVGSYDKSVTYDSQDNGSFDIDTPSSQENMQDLDGNATGTVQDPGTLQGSDLSDATNYHILPISMLLLGGYLATYYLFKKGILKPQQHKRIWNMLLTFGFIGTGITGVLLTLMINMGISTAYNPQINYIHAEMAVIMVIGTVIHMYIYRKPMKNHFNILLGLKSKTKTMKIMKNQGTSK
ncbi:DUF4405 domain-containing protein [Methanobacterium alcaliphilum]|uniref:DUF4405 domain-containing protein n=1 Tax=Methanobacterium alcaliphilum TaxID=392018 RepID=UPI00200AC5AD|nr:DUF4405 domain-containing protein [Methanobacterium alcaliphilum]MCK9151145.1 DUF4405 domain-containing protein [Methanobacterium alcaliphilum]